MIRYRLLYPVLLLSEGVYSFLVLRVKAPSIRSHDLFTSMMALVISLVLLAVVMQLRIQDGNARIRYRMLSETDLLTGNLNKAACENSVRQYIARHGGSTCALLMLDIDDFKQINDMFGHQVGDWLLEKMGRCCAMYSVPPILSGAQAAMNLCCASRIFSGKTCCGKSAARFRNSCARRQ